MISLVNLVPFLACVLKSNHTSKLVLGAGILGAIRHPGHGFGILIKIDS